MRAVCVTPNCTRPYFATALAAHACVGAADPFLKQQWRLQRRCHAAIITRAALRGCHRFCRKKEAGSCKQICQKLPCHRTAREVCILDMYTSRSLLDMIGCICSTYLDAIGRNKTNASREMSTFPSGRSKREKCTEVHSGVWIGRERWSISVRRSIGWSTRHGDTESRSLEPA